MLIRTGIYPRQRAPDPGSPTLLPKAAGACHINQSAGMIWQPGGYATSSGSSHMVMLSDISLQMKTRLRILVQTPSHCLHGRKTGSAKDR